jgi:phage terminase Nu1 subunit (DNA packaging protein)
MNVDARGGTLNNVGRDQYNLQLIIDGSTSERTVSGILRDFGLVPQLPISGPATLPRRDVLARAQHRYGPDSAGDIATSLTVKILQLLIDRRESSDDRALVQELKTLQQTLTLVGLAIQTYEYTPLGRHLANNIIPEVEQCCVVLDELFQKINNYREGLYPTSIRNLWHQVRRSGSEVDGLSSLSTRLSLHQRSLGEFLVALNS